MNFYFDESGDFRPDDDGVQRVGIVAGITIPESAEGEVFAKFDQFVKSLARSAFKKGEPKGNLLTYDERRRFAQMIAGNKKIVVTPAMLDIASMNRAKNDVRGNMVHRMRELAEQCLYATLKGEVHLLANQLKNLSDNQCLRLGSLAYCIKRAFEQTIILLSGKEYFDCWDKMRFEIDPVRVSPNNCEEQVFKMMMLMWLQKWSQESPIMIDPKIHTKDHPLIKNYSTDDDKFDLAKIYRDNLHYPQSSESKGLQIADMVASIIHYAVRGIATLENLMNYGLLLKNNYWPPKDAHGLFTLTDQSNVDYNRYAGLNEAVAKVRSGDECGQ